MFKRIEQFYDRQPFLIIVLIRIAVFLGLALILFLVGLMIGYSVLGSVARQFSFFTGEVFQKIL